MLGGQTARAVDRELAALMLRSTMTDTRALLHLTGADADAHQVPAEVLVRALDGVQQAIYTLAAAEERIEVARRFKPDAKFRERHQLTCLVPQAGSYSLPVCILGPPQQSLLSPNAQAIFAKLYDALSAIVGGSPADLAKTIVDSTWRERFLRVVKTSLVPRAGERWRLGLRRDITDVSSEVTLTSAHAKTLREWKDSPAVDEHEIPVIGQLTKIDFARNTLYLRCRQGDGHIQIECVYDQELEPMLVAQRRDLVQVIGRCTVNSQGLPQEITDVTSIEAVDLSPMRFDSFESAGRTLKVKGEPLVLDPTLDDETQQLYSVVSDDLDLHAFAYSREQLVDEIAAHIFCLWDQYAAEDSSRLTDDARQLAAAVLARFDEVK